MYQTFLCSYIQFYNPFLRDESFFCGNQHCPTSAEYSSNFTSKSQLLDQKMLQMCVIIHCINKSPRSLYLEFISLSICQDPRLEFMRKFAIGLVSGTVSSCVNIPFDVAKSRIQGPQPVPGEIKYRSCFQTMGLVYREEG